MAQNCIIKIWLQGLLGWLQSGLYIFACISSIFFLISFSHSYEVNEVMDDVSPSTLSETSRKVTWINFWSRKRYTYLALPQFLNLNRTCHFLAGLESITLPYWIDSSSVVFRESVRKNAWECFEKKGFAENRHFQGTANFGYLEAIKCHFEAKNRTFG